MSQRTRAAGLIIAGLLAFTPCGVVCAQETSPSCTTGLVLGVADSAATDVVVAFCRPARARNLTGLLRVSVVSVGNTIVVTVARIDSNTGVEESVRLQSRTIEDAVRDAPQLIAMLQGAAPASLRETKPSEAPPSAVGSTDAKPAETLTTPDESVQTPSNDVGPTTLVVIRSPTRVQLQRNNAGAWETACMSPCERELPTKNEYRMVDNNGRPLQAFRLEGSGGGVKTIEVSPRNLLVDVLGTTGIILGTFLFYGGLVASSRDTSKGTPFIALGLLGVVAGPLSLLLNRSGITIKDGRAPSSSSSSSPDSSSSMSIVPPPCAIADDGTRGSSTRALALPQHAATVAPIVSFTF